MYRYLPEQHDGLEYKMGYLQIFLRCGFDKFKSALAPTHDQQYLMSQVSDIASFTEQKIIKQIDELIQDKKKNEAVKGKQDQEIQANLISLDKAV